MKVKLKKGLKLKTKAKADKEEYAKPKKVKKVYPRGFTDYV